MIPFKWKLRWIGLGSFLSMGLVWWSLGGAALLLDGVMQHLQARYSDVYLMLHTPIQEQSYQTLQIQLENDYRLQKAEEWSGLENSRRLAAELGLELDWVEKEGRPILPAMIQLRIRPVFYSESTSVVHRLEQFEAVKEVVHQAVDLHYYYRINQGWNAFRLGVLLLLSACWVLQWVLFVQTVLNTHWLDAAMLLEHGLERNQLSRAFMREVYLLLLVATGVLCVCCAAAVQLWNAMVKPSGLLPDSIDFSGWEFLPFIFFILWVIIAVLSFTVVRQWILQLHLNHGDTSFLNRWAEHHK